MSRPPRDLRCQTLRKGSQEIVLLTFTPEDRSPLSEAERETALALWRGHSNTEIATLRGVAVRTVANQVASLFKKLGVSSRTELAARIDLGELL